jgi:hypothetical protein
MVVGGLLVVSTATDAQENRDRFAAGPNTINGGSRETKVERTGS